MQPIRATLTRLIAEMVDDEDFDDAADRAMPYLKDLLARPDLLTYGIERTGFHVDRSSWLYYDPDFSVAMAHVKAGTEIPIHNHGTWEIVAPYRGAVSYTSYAREDDLSEPGHANLRIVDQTLLEAGDVALCPPPPHDVHGWTVVRDAYLLAVVGPGIATRREYYEPEESRYLEKEAAWPRLLG